MLIKLQASHLITGADRDLFADWAAPVAFGDDMDEPAADTAGEEEDV